MMYRFCHSYHLLLLLGFSKALYGSSVQWSKAVPCALLWMNFHPPAVLAEHEGDIIDIISSSTPKWEEDIEGTLRGVNYSKIVSSKSNVHGLRKLNDGILKGKPSLQDRLEAFFEAEDQQITFDSNEVMRVENGFDGQPEPRTIKDENNGIEWIFNPEPMGSFDHEIEARFTYKARLASIHSADDYAIVKELCEIRDPYTTCYIGGKYDGQFDANGFSFNLESFFWLDGTEYDYILPVIAVLGDECMYSYPSDSPDVITRFVGAGGVYTDCNIPRAAVYKRFL